MDQNREERIMVAVGEDAGYMQVWADDTNRSVAFTENFRSAYVTGKSFLQSHQEYQDESKVDSGVSQYIQAGTPHNGSWSIVQGPNLTSITYYLNGTNCYARAIWDTLFWG
jgi:hypothetical protein